MLQGDLWWKDLPNVLPLSTQVQPLFFKEIKSLKSLSLLVPESTFWGNLSLWESTAWLHMSTSNVFLNVAEVDVGGSICWTSHRSFTYDPNCKHTSSRGRNLSTMLNVPTHYLVILHCVSWHDVNFGCSVRKFQWFPLAVFQTVVQMRYFHSQKLHSRKWQDVRLQLCEGISRPSCRL